MKKYLFLFICGFVIPIIGHALWDYTSIFREEAFFEDASYESERSPQKQYEYEEAVIHYGSKYAFHILYGMWGDALPYAILMAHHYHYPRAYDKFCSEYIPNNIGKMDSISIKQTLDFLWEGASYQNRDCMYSLANLYREGIYVKKDSLLADSLHDEANSIMYEYYELYGYPIKK